MNLDAKQLHRYVREPMRNDQAEFIKRYQEMVAWMKTVEADSSAPDVIRVPEDWQPGDDWRKGAQ